MTTPRTATSREMSDTCSRTFVPELKMPEQSRPLLRGEELSAEQKAALPKLMKVDNLPRKGVPKIFAWSGGGQWEICEKLRDRIEELEPGVHDFVPFEVKHADGSADYGTYYHLIYTVKIDCIDFERSHFMSGIGFEAAEKSGFDPAIYFSSAKYPLYLKKDVIVGHHLWRGSVGNSIKHTYCSDELGEYIKKEKLFGAGLLKCRVS